MQQVCYYDDVPRTCTLCRDSRRKEIDAAIASRTVSLRSIAGSFNVSMGCIMRHRPHITALTERMADHQDIVIYDRLEQLTRKALDVIEAGLGKSDTQLKEAIKAAHVLRGYVQLFASRMDRQEDLDRKASTSPDADFIAFLEANPMVNDQYIEWLRGRTIPVESNPIAV